MSEARKTKQEAAFSPKQSEEPMNYLDEAVERLDAKLTASGCMVKVKEPSGTTKFQVTLPQGRASGK